MPRNKAKALVLEDRKEAHEHICESVCVYAARLSALGLVNKFIHFLWPLRLELV